MKSQPDGPLPDPLRLQQLFHAAADLAVEEQVEFLARECPGRGAEYQVVLALLAAERSEPTAWKGNAFELEARQTAAHSGQARVGQFFGPYRILRHVSTGGMGFVYEAVRADDQYQKKVAIKIVQRSLHDGADSAAMIERFRGERQILARLEHPNIARLLEGGTTSDDVPYLVMEYVEGVPLNQHASQRSLNQNDRLKLFLQICDAVQYAHRNLVVHRDLKPSNILVTADGVPKLLDFGIAKVLNAEGAALTATAGAMTLEYASPEQVLGAPITASSDIYSLGVLLFELLSGRRLYQNATSAMELTQAICTDAPQTLSTKATPDFDTDLEKIVQMALRKEPDRRYASVGQFAEDIRRYLDGYTVAARTDTRGYRALKFVGRNKTAVLAGSLGVLALLAGIAATSWQAHIAERRFNSLRKLANSYLFEFHEAIKDLPGATPARQLVVRRALEYLDSLAQERGNDAALRLELATAYKRVGDVQGRPGYASLGDTAGALASYRKALTLFERSSAAAAVSTGAGSDMALCYSGMASILANKGDLSGASESLHKAIPIMERLVAAHPRDLEVRDTLAEVYRHLADILGNSTQANLGDTKGAVTFYNKALAIRERLVAENPKDRLQRSSLSAVYSRLAVTQRSIADYPGALAMYRQSLKVDEQLEKDEPDNASFRRNAANANRILALLSLDVGNLEDARKYADQSATLNARLVKDDSKDMEAQEHLANSYFTQGTILARTHDPVRAQQHFDSALAIYERLMAHNPTYLPGGLNSTYNLMAAMAIQNGDGGKAVSSARKQLQIADRLLKISSANEFARRNQGLAFLQLGQGHELLARKSISEWREARSSYQQSLDVWLDLRKKGTLIPRYIPRLDEAAAAIARCDRALPK